MHKRKLIIDKQTYHYHISGKTLCIWYPDNTKKVIKIDGGEVTCRKSRLFGMLLHPSCGVQITPSIIKDIILGNKSHISIESVTPHECPFKAEINNDHSLCRCCKSCTRQCAEDI